MVQVQERQRVWMEAYAPLFGSIVEYTTRSGERHAGKLVDIQINIDTKEPEAFIRRWRTVLAFSKTTDIVPLALVLTKPPKFKNWKNSSAYSFSETRDSTKQSVLEKDPSNSKLFGGIYQYGQHMYVAKLWPAFKVDDDVAWTPETGSQPFIGKVKFIGQYESPDGYPVIEAIVQFDQPTNHLPGYISRPPVNRNLVNVSELQTLESFIRKTEGREVTEQQPTETSSVGNSSHCPVDYSLIDFSEEVESKEPIVSVFDNASSSTTPSFSTRSPFSPPPSVSTAPSFSTASPFSPPPSVSKVPVFSTTPSFSTTSPFSPPPLSVSTAPLFSTTPSFLSAPSFSAPPQTSHIASTSVPKKTLHFQSGHNSSYMDATLFSLFSYSTVFDETMAKVGVVECKTHVEKLLKTILLNSIINPLRWDCQIPPENTFQLRRILAENVSPKYLQDAADADEFLINLCKLMNTPEMLEYSNGTKEFIHQVAIPDEVNHFNISFKCVQTLVQKSFSLSALKLTRRPRQAFVIKMPMSDGKLVGCDGVIPNFTLNLTPILTSEAAAGASIEDRAMKLSAVICRKDKHFVAFVRSGQAVESSWIFMDPCNSGGEPGPQVEVLEDLSKNIEACLDEAGFSGGELNLEEPGCNEFSLFRDAYMCIYT